MDEMSVWPEPDAELFDESQGRKIKSRLFGFTKVLPWRKTVVRKLGEIMETVERSCGDIRGVNVTHYLVSYGIPLGNGRILEFGLVDIRDEALDVNTRYRVSVSKY